MRAIALTWSVFGIVGIAISVSTLVRQPLNDVGFALRAAILLIVCAGAFFCIWAAVRERWPDLRECKLPFHPYIDAGTALIFVSFFVFVGIAAIVIEMARHQTAGVAFRLCGLFIVSAAILVGAWALHHNLEFGRRLLRFIAIVAFIGSLAILILAGARPVFAATWVVGAVVLLALCIATLWQLRSRRPA